MAVVHDICRFRGVTKVQPTEDTQTMPHKRLTISLVVRVISRSKNNRKSIFSKRNGQGWFGEKQTKWRTSESDEMSVNFKCENK